MVTPTPAGVRPLRSEHTSLNDVGFSGTLPLMALPLFFWWQFYEVYEQALLYFGEDTSCMRVDPDPTLNPLHPRRVPP